MTTTPTTGKAPSNGKATAAEPQRKTGMAYVDEAIAYHMVMVAHDAAFEAERLCNDIYRAVSSAYMPGGGRVSDAAHVAMSADTYDKACEATECFKTAERYLRYMTRDEQPPF